jgi:hypothetical protein
VFRVCGCSRVKSMIGAKPIASVKQRFPAFQLRCGNKFSTARPGKYHVETARQPSHDRRGRKFSVFKTLYPSRVEYDSGQQGGFPYFRADPSAAV